MCAGGTEPQPESKSGSISEHFAPFYFARKQAAAQYIVTNKIEQATASLLGFGIQGSQGKALDPLVNSF